MLFSNQHIDIVKEHINMDSYIQLACAVEL